MTNSIEHLVGNVAASPAPSSVEEIREAIADLTAKKATLAAVSADVFQKALALGGALATQETARHEVDMAAEVVRELFNATFPPPTP